MSGLPLHDLPLFLAAGLLLNLTPGPDMLFVAGSSAAHGRHAGVMASLGVGAGCLVHTLLAAVGLSALLATSAVAFEVVKWAGAAYLVWIGIGMLYRRQAAAETAVDVAPQRVFWQGALTNTLNPKVALFFLAFLPQFIVPDAPGQALAFLALGALFNVGGTAVNIVVALLAGSARERLADTPVAGRLGAWLRRAVGALFIGLGAKLALGSR
ncbi:LysE family translocator [Piscinibacter sp. XHJ-5]|uniref:LysE family translocator n=1 Tax=Piscinibacter sp. XHJ-5 TaxID=3037797 RepID=UPI002452E2FC|nr:LysE family translocator [Piscinibacter sp. XHJ-5]